MYRKKDRQTGYLFPELFPFGGKLNEENRWLKIAKLIPWDELEEDYAKYFSNRMGRPALDGRLVLGALMLKHMTGAGDEEIENQIEENPYFQAFCGYENFQTHQIFDESSLSRVRKRIGAKFFRELEKKTYEVLVKRKILKKRGLLVDGTVYPEDIRYPTDTGLLNTAREWLVQKIDQMGKRLGKRKRTYKRKARQEYLSFSKKRKKTKKQINKMRRKLLGYVRRNLKQLDEFVEQSKEKGDRIRDQIRKRTAVIRKLYEQQWEMWKEKKHRVEQRIVSLHKPQVRPIVRGKAGKDVEFGPKVALSHVDGFMMLDAFSYENFNEAKRLETQIEQYRERFGKDPDWCMGDQLYGNRENRKMLKDRGIRHAFVPLGKKKRDPNKQRWRKKMHRIRNRVEGGIGHSKEHAMVHRIRYRIEDGGEIWLRLGLFGMNMRTAAKRI